MEVSRNSGCLVLPFHHYDAGAGEGAGVVSGPVAAVVDVWKSR